jgi:two-component system NarL family response regulator
MAEVRTIKLLAVDPHPIVQVGLRTVLESAQDVELVGVCEDALSALRLCAEKQPDLVLLEVALPGMSGVELCRAIKRDHPRTEVLVLTADDRDETVFEAIRAGAAGYILKDITPDNLVRAIHAIARGQTMVHPRIARRVLDRLSLIAQDQEDGRLYGDGLTEREVEILVEVAKGATNKEIARKLFISESTVKSRLRNIFRKISVRDRAEAAAYAIRKGYLR